MFNAIKRLTDLIWVVVICLDLIYLNHIRRFTKGHKWIGLKESLMKLFSYITGVWRRGFSVFRTHLHRFKTVYRLKVDRNPDKLVWASEIIGTSFLYWLLFCYLETLSIDFFCRCGCLLPFFLCLLCAFVNPIDWGIVWELTLLV